MRDTQARFSGLTVSLHWLVGLSIIALLAVGLYMEQTQTYFLYPIHKSIGLLIFIPIMIRVVWRVMNGWPEAAGNYKAIEHLMAKMVHWVLIIGTIALPVSGMMMSGAGGRGLDIFGLELLATNPDPNDPGKVIPLNETAAYIGHVVHSIGGKVMILAVVLHIAGALKHHIADKDGTLQRMLGKSIA